MVEAMYAILSTLDYTVNCNTEQIMHEHLSYLCEMDKRELDVQDEKKDEIHLLSMSCEFRIEDFEVLEV